MEPTFQHSIQCEQEVRSHQDIAGQEAKAAAQSRTVAIATTIYRLLMELDNGEVKLVNDELAPGVTRAGGVTLGCSSLRSGAGLISPVCVGSHITTCLSWF